MACNFTLDAIGASVAFGKGNARIKATSSTLMQVRDNADAAFANLQVADGAVDDDAVTLRQLQAAQVGLYWKEPVRAASTANVTIASPGATMDGVTLANGDRVLLKDQSTGTENGIYIFDTPTTPLTRAPDMATGSDATNAAMFVSEGTTQADQAYVETADPAIVGTDALTFQQFASVSAGVTSITSVDDGGGAGTFASVVKSGAAPTPQIRSISNGSQISAAVSAGTNEVQLAVVAASITNTEIASDTILESNLAPATATLYRSFTFQASDFPATPGSTTVNIGSALPTPATVMDGGVLVTTAFDNAPDLQIGTASDANAVFAASEVDLASVGQCVSSKGSVQSGQQLIATLTTNTAQPTRGQGKGWVRYVRF